MKTPRKVHTHPGAVLLALCISGLLHLSGARAQQALIIDHTCTDVSQIPDCWIEAAKAQWRVTYGHTSHGSQIVSGINFLNPDNGMTGSTCPSCNDYSCGGCLYDFCDDYYYYRYGTGNDPAPPGTLSFWDRRFQGASDLGNPDRTSWEAATRTMLDDPRFANRNLVIWSWCGQADTTPENMQIYLDLMSGLVADYPNVTFVYMTGHLNGTGVDGNLNQRNNQIRDHVLNTGGVLFDFADIESYDPSGNAFLHLNATDSCNYYSGGTHNWADEWCAANPESDMCVDCGTTCAHSRCLNCSLKGRAFWWLLARLSGWDGTARADFDRNCTIDLDDFLAFADCLAGPGTPPAPSGTDEATCRAVFDLDDDLDVDLDDFASFQALFEGA